MPFYLLLITLLNLFPIQKTKPIEIFYQVVKVADGDTFTIQNGNDKIKVRLIGIDAPESHPSKYKKIGYYGSQSQKYLTKLILFKKVKLMYDVGRKDKYGRTLAYVYLSNGVFLNGHLISEGYAKVLTVPPNVKYASLFVKLQQKARENKKGLWK